MKKFFKLEEKKTDVKTEVIAGITTFMTMAYIIFVNPDLLNSGGMNAAGALFEDAAAFNAANDPVVGAVMTATILAAALSTILMGLLTNYPFALASGMGLNAYFAFTVAPQAGWQGALAAVFISGVVFLLLSVFGFIEKIDGAVPKTLKKAVAAGIGLFIAFIGLSNAGIVVEDPATLVTLGNLTEPGPMVAVFGLIITAILMAKRVKGAILLGIILSTIFTFIIGVQPVPTGMSDIVGAPNSLAPIAGQLDFSAVFQLGIMTIFALVFVDLFDTMGTLLGTGAKAGFLDEKGNLPKVKNAMLADAVGTMGGALMGTSTVTTYVESTAGISEGGRTGLTSVVVGVLFLASLFFAPFAGLVTSEATAPALIIVGVLMMGAAKDINFDDFSEAFPAFVTMVVMPFAFSIADGIAAGFITYPIVKIFAGKVDEVHWFMYFLAAISVIHFVM